MSRQQEALCLLAVDQAEAPTGLRVQGRPVLPLPRPAQRTPTETLVVLPGLVQLTWGGAVTKETFNYTCTVSVFVYLGVRWLSLRKSD